MKKNNQKGNALSFVVMLISLILLIFVGLGFAKNSLFNTLREDIPNKKNVLYESLSDNSVVSIIIKGVTLEVEVAKSKEKKAKGLSKRYELDNEGMLFIFDKSGVYPFWNKNTYIPLDILWIENDKVAHILEGLPVYNGVETITEFPNVTSSFVLEVKHGFVKDNNIIIGSSIIIKK
ncbi:MAG: DUF192 domain-containing protein [Patescibacteria group bacterium]